MERILFLVAVCATEAVNSATAAKPASEDHKNIEELLVGNQPWWDVHPPNSSAEGIGHDVPVLAHIFYDNAYVNGNNRKKSRSEDVEDTNADMKKYFEQLFQQVQRYFKNQSININISITAVQQMTNLSVVKGHWFYARETLENVEAYGASLAKPNDTIFYLFTWHRDGFKPESYDQAKFFGTSDAETRGTFCSEKTSAAVVRHLHKSWIYWTTVKATAFIFGSKHFASFSTQDRITMNKTFLRCPVPNKEAPPTEEIPAC